MAEPKTVAEASGWKKTSRYEDVVAFLDDLAPLPQAGRLRRVTIGKTEEGRALPLVLVAEPPLDGEDPARQAVASGKLRLLVNANIHAGEVEGKEAVQILLRELARGDHAELLAKAVLLFVPIYNADGNERIDIRHRVTQNGPDGGVGQRRNADGYDLNRDFVKADTAECRALLGVFRDYDPHLFMDLHTTDGSTHGYHLTYAPSLATNVDPDLARYTRRELLPGIRKAMKNRHGFRTYDYGNFVRRRPENGWATYDHRPRFGTNYFGLRNRIAILSEAYSHISFEARVRVTRAFVLETLRALCADAERVAELCHAADLRVEERHETLQFGFASRLEDPWEDEVLVGSAERRRIEGAGFRVVAKDGFEPRRIPVQTAFVATEFVPYPEAWAILGPSDRVLSVLAAHGIVVERVAQATEVPGEVFEATEVGQAPLLFEKHHETTVAGAWQRRRVALPAGTAVVSARQRLARVAAELLEARSEDSLATWNYFDEEVQLVGYPVVRLLARPGR